MCLADGINAVVEKPHWAAQLLLFMMVLQLRCLAYWSRNCSGMSLSRHGVCLLKETSEIVVMRRQACMHGHLYTDHADVIMQVPPFKKTLMEAMPYIDFLFGNETEACAFAESEGWTTTDVAEIALKVSHCPPSCIDTSIFRLPCKTSVPAGA